MSFNMAAWGIFLWMLKKFLAIVFVFGLDQLNIWLKSVVLIPKITQMWGGCVIFFQ